MDAHHAPGPSCLSSSVLGVCPTDGGLGTVERFFRGRVAALGYDAVTVDRAWDVLSGFGAFGFCRAHAAAFALTTWQSAWLKVHFPVKFMAGLLEHDPGMYPKRLLLAEARRMGVPILPLDVNRSTDKYQVEVAPGGRRGIRLSLADVTGLSAVDRARILAGAPFTSLADFADRARPRRATLSRLAAVGAFDSLHRGPGGSSPGATSWPGPGSSPPGRWVRLTSCLGSSPRRWTPWTCRPSRRAARACPPPSGSTPSSTPCTSTPTGTCWLVSAWSPPTGSSSSATTPAC